MEAQACGTPVIAFGRGGATETVIPADGTNWEKATGVFFYEQSELAIRDAVKQFMEWEACFDRQIIRKNAEKFSAGRFRAEIAEFIDSKFNAQV